VIYIFSQSFLREILEEYGVNAVLEFTYFLTRDYIPQYYFDEMQGMADATGIDFMTIVRFNMFPELVQAHCTMVGAWGDSAAERGKNNTLYQLRGLDWSTNGPVQKYPALLVYHPSASGANNFASFSWDGFVGALTGISSAPIGICEKVWLSYNGSFARSGNPWHFVLRDILNWDTSVDDAISRVFKAHRTCSIFVGVGDPYNKFKAIEYSLDQVEVFDDRTYPQYTEHPRMPGVVYIDKHRQPSHNSCLSSLLQQNYGKIDALALLQIAAIHGTGDTHAAIYDYSGSFIYLSSAGVYTNGTATPAYSRQWARVSLTSLWNEKINN